MRYKMTVEDLIKLLQKHNPKSYVGYRDYHEEVGWGFAYVEPTEVIKHTKNVVIIV